MASAPWGRTKSHHEESKGDTALITLQTEKATAYRGYGTHSEIQIRVGWCRLILGYLEGEQQPGRGVIEME